MKKAIEFLIRQRNPTFRFDVKLNNVSLMQFVWNQAWNMVRAMRLLIYFRSPKWAMFGPGVALFNLPCISWGKFLKLGRHVYISALGKEGIAFGNNVGVGAYSSIIVSTSLNNLGKSIKIGNNVGIGEYAYLGGAGGLSIGDDCIIGQYLSCHPENHNYEILETPIRHQGVNRKGISIGSNCWIGSKVTILDGVSVGNGCVIAAGAVVTKSFPANRIIGGVPAKLIKRRNE